jgi:hypothetical protein
MDTDTTDTTDTTVESTLKRQRGALACAAIAGGAIALVPVPPIRSLGLILFAGTSVAWAMTAMAEDAIELLRS